LHWVRPAKKWWSEELKFKKLRYPTDLVLKLRFLFRRDQTISRWEALDSSVKILLENDRDIEKFAQKRLCAKFCIRF
jgi:hypothetical protein